MSRLLSGVLLGSLLLGCVSPQSSDGSGGATGGAWGGGGDIREGDRTGGRNAVSPRGAGGRNDPGPSNSGGAGPDPGAGGAAPAATGGSGGANAARGGSPGNDAAGGSAAGPDAPAGDRPMASPDLPAATCAPGALLCEDFEPYPVGPSLAGVWSTDVVGGSLQVDATRPFRGGKALHISAKAGIPTLLQIVKQGAPLFPVPGNTFYGRMMMWLTQMPTGEVHFNTVQANGLLPGSTRVAKYAYGAMYSKLMAGYTIRVNEAALPTVDCGKSSSAGYPEKTWVCIEWKFDGANNEMHTWLDGQAQTGVDVVKIGGGCVAGGAPAGGVWQAPTFNKLMIGWYAQPFNLPIDVWVDDVAVGTERLGCPHAP